MHGAIHSACSNLGEYSLPDALIGGVRIGGGQRLNVETIYSCQSIGNNNSNNNDYIYEIKKEKEADEVGDGSVSSSADVCPSNRISVESKQRIGSSDPSERSIPPIKAPEGDPDPNSGVEIGGRKMREILPLLL